MKAFFNSGIGKFMVTLYAIAIHALFALGAYYFGAFIASLIFPELPALHVGIGIGFAIMTFLGAMWIFLYGEYAYEDIEHYFFATSKDFRWAYWLVMAAIGLTEVSSLAFRVYNTPGLAPQIIMAIFGILALVIAFCLGKIIHAMANRPQALAAQRSREMAGREFYDRTLKLTRKMSPDQLYRYSEGDPGVVDEVAQAEYDSQAQKGLRQYQAQQRKEEKRQSKLDRENAKRAAYAENKNVFNRMFNRPRPQPKAAPMTQSFTLAQSNPGDHLSQNGRQN